MSNQLIPEIITVQEYVDFVGALEAPTRPEDTQAAINFSYVQIDGICSDLYMCWTCNDKTSHFYRNEGEKNHIKQAMILQTKYNLDNALDFSHGTSISYQNGNTSFTKNKNTKTEVLDEVKGHLVQARVYKPIGSYSAYGDKSNNRKDFSGYAEFLRQLLKDLDLRYVRNVDNSLTTTQYISTYKNKIHEAVPTGQIFGEAVKKADLVAGTGIELDKSQGDVKISTKALTLDDFIKGTNILLYKDRQNNKLTIIAQDSTGPASGVSALYTYNGEAVVGVDGMITLMAGQNMGITLDRNNKIFTFNANVPQLPSYAAGKNIAITHNEEENQYTFDFVSPKFVGGTNINVLYDKTYDQYLFDGIPYVFHAGDGINIVQRGNDVTISSPSRPLPIPLEFEAGNEHTTVTTENNKVTISALVPDLIAGNNINIYKTEPSNPNSSYKFDVNDNIAFHHLDNLTENNFFGTLTGFTEGVDIIFTKLDLYRVKVDLFVTIDWRLLPIFGFSISSNGISDYDFMISYLAKWQYSLYFNNPKIKLIEFSFVPPSELASGVSPYGQRITNPSAVHSWNSGEDVIEYICNPDSSVNRYDVCKISFLLDSEQQ